MEKFTTNSTNWSPEELQRFREWLVSFLKSSWGDYYNPTMYKDAGLDDGYALRQLALESGRALREKASERFLNLCVDAGMLEAVPEL
jgi:hypothetical protein